MNIERENLFFEQRKRRKEKICYICNMLTDFRFQVFLQVVQEMSFTRAAAALNISQPAITKHIKELERSVGGALFLRQGNRITPTDKAIALLPSIKEIIDRYEQLNELISTDNHSFSGTLRIGASTTVAQYVLPAILAKFGKSYPDIRIVLTTGNSEGIGQEVISEKLDFAIVEDNNYNHSLHYEYFADDEILLVTARPNPRTTISIDELTKLPLVIRENGSGTLSVVEKELAKHHILRKHLNIIMQLGSSEGILRFMIASDSYALLSRIVVQDLLREHKVQPIHIEGIRLHRTLRFVSLHGKSNRLTELFKAFCLSHNNF